MARQHHGRGSGERPLRVGEAIRHALADVFARGDLRDPDVSDVSVTVSEVRVSPDLRHAVAYVYPLGPHDSERLLAGLARCAPYLRGQVSRRVPLKFSPTLTFELDRSFEEAARIEAMLQRPDVARDLVDPADPSDDALSDDDAPRNDGDDPDRR